jgi:hypothetical protein
MLGCAFTVRNRIRAGWYGGNWLDVLAHHQEWSGTTQQSTEIPDPRVLSFMMLLQQIDGIFTGATDDHITIKRDGEASRISLTGPPPVALYYSRLDRTDNEWFLNNISRCPEKHPMIAQVGLMSFFA